MFHAFKDKISKNHFGFILTFQYFWSKAGLNSIRGFLWSISQCKSPFNLFLLGKGVRIVCGQKLTTGFRCFISDYSYINCLSLSGVKLGDNCTIREFAWLQLTSRLSEPGEGIIIGNNTYIGPRVNLGAAGMLVIGNHCLIGASVSFIGENHRFAPGEEIFEQGVERVGIEIGDNCWIGNNSVILDGVILGAGCVVGAGAVVTKSFEANSVLVVNPARLLKVR